MVSTSLLQIMHLSPKSKKEQKYARKSLQRFNENQMKIKYFRSFRDIHSNIRLLRNLY